MPIHDWTKQPPFLFPHLHLGWLLAIKDALNNSLPDGHYSLLEPRYKKIESIHSLDLPDIEPFVIQGGRLEKRPPPKTTLVSRSDNQLTHRWGNRVTVRRQSDERVISIVEVVLPGSKISRTYVREFVVKAVELLLNDIHVTFVDPFPPGTNDPHGLHVAIWKELLGLEEPDLPKPLSAVAYERGSITTAYVEPFAVGELIPTIPVFLEPDAYVDLPLETTYREAFDATPKRWRDVLESNGY